MARGVGARSAEAGQMMTAQQVCEELQISRRSLYRLPIPRYKLGSITRWKESDIDDFLKMVKVSYGDRKTGNEVGLPPPGRRQKGGSAQVGHEAGSAEGLPPLSYFR